MSVMPSGPCNIGTDCLIAEEFFQGIELTCQLLLGKFLVDIRVAAATDVDTTFPHLLHLIALLEPLVPVAQTRDEVVEGNIDVASAEGTKLAHVTGPLGGAMDAV